MANPARDNHYVPQAALRRWSADATCVYAYRLLVSHEDVPLTFTPLEGGGGYRFTAPTRFDRLFTGITIGRPTYLQADDRRGTTHIRPEDTCDGDYGRLLFSRPLSGE